MKKQGLAIFLSLIMVFFVGCNIQKAEDYYQEEDLTGKDTVTVSIRCDTILNNMDKLDSALEKHIPKDGVILQETKIVYEEKMSAYDALIKASKKDEIVVNASGTSQSAYIVGINGIKEFSCGELSGWIYRVNGDIMSSSCGEAKLEKDDKIEFLYTCDLGQDIVE